MTAPQAAPPPERLPGGEERAGSITLTATVASGRRSTALFGHRDGEATPVIVRRPLANPARFLADCEEAGGLRVGGAGVTEDGMPTMPAVVGESLATVLASLFERQEPLPIHLALTVAMGIADELLKLGKDGVHGDLVPHHVLIGYDGSVALIDPAASAYLDRAQSAGREGYRSPEHIDADGLTKASDIFVLGILLFEMTTGHPLYAEPTHADNEVRIKAGEMPKPRTLVGDGYPIELQLVLRKMLRPQTSGRFADARAAKDALRLAATSRSDVGPDALGQWLSDRFRERRAAWDDLLDATRGRTAPMPVASRAATDETTPPSRAPTALESRPSRPFSLSGITAEPTVPTRALPRTPSPADDKESPLEVDTFQELAPVSGPLTMEAIERADAEERSLFSFPSASETDNEGEVADDPTASLPRARKRGAGRAAIPGIIPDLPTEVSGRRTPRSDESTMDEASEPTALDEIVESDLLSGSLEALTLEPLPSLQLDDDGDGAPRWQAPLELEASEETATGDAPGRVLPDVSFDEPAPSTGPSPAPFSAEDFLVDDEDEDALPALAADDGAFAPLDADFLDSLADDTPAPLASADFLDALPRPEDAGFDVDASPTTDRQNAAGALALDDEAPDTFPPDGLLGLDTPHEGVPVAPHDPGAPATELSTHSGGGLPAPIDDDHPTRRGSALPAPSGDDHATRRGLPGTSADGITSG
ncbi:MAG: protein kinase, partial [Deltaproteobacteria bacterium]